MTTYLFELTGSPCSRKSLEQGFFHRGGNQNNPIIFSNHTIISLALLRTQEGKEQGEFYFKVHHVLAAASNDSGNRACMKELSCFSSLDDFSIYQLWYHINKLRFYFQGTYSKIDA
jgi:hypothetical protein